MAAVVELHEANRAECQLRTDLGRLGYNSETVPPMILNSVQNPHAMSENITYYWCEEAKLYVRTDAEIAADVRKAKLAAAVGARNDCRDRERGDQIRNVRLSGAVGKKFGKLHRLAVACTAEAIRALCVMIPGFQHELMVSRDRGVAYACFLGKKNIGVDQLHLTGGTEDIRIAGAKAGGFLQIIVGVALIAAS